jgi:small conductance mechanosensitive channel
MSDAETLPDIGSFQQAIGLDMDALVYTSGPVVVRIFGLSILSIIAARMIKRAVSRVEDDRTRRQLDFFAPKIARVLVVAIGLEVAGIDISGMAALLTTIGFTGAVVFTSLGQNMVAGVVTSLDDMYNVGDVIEVDDVFGTVVSRSLLRTELALPDGTTAWIPNAMISDQKTLNHSRLGGYRISVEVPLDHNPDLALATKVMNHALARLEWPVPGRPSYICLDHVHGEAIVYRAYAWIANRSIEPYYQSLLLTTLVNALDDAGVSVGYTANLSMYPQANEAAA